MICISPIKLTNGAVVPCGRCGQCHANRRNEWTFRLQQEVKVSDTAWFVTFTYDDSCLPVNIDPVDGATVPTLDKSDLQKFLKKLRSRQGDNKIRYFMVGEYGPDTFRPHYHGIIFNMTDQVIKKINEIWGLGFVTVGQVNDARIHYLSGYFITKSLEFPEGMQRQFNMMSLKPAIGYSYYLRAGHFHKTGKSFRVKFDNGFNGNLPRYYKDKIFSRVEKENHNREIEKAVAEAEEKGITLLQREYFKKTFEQQFHRSNKILKQSTKFKKL